MVRVNFIVLSLKVLASVAKHRAVYRLSDHLFGEIAASTDIDAALP
jgi:hypothetical protein